MILQGRVYGSTPFGGHLDSRWSPCGVQMDFKQNYRLKSFLDGVQMESRWIYGVHMESVGECKVQRIQKEHVGHHKNLHQSTGNCVSQHFLKTMYFLSRHHAQLLHACIWDHVINLQPSNPFTGLAYSFFLLSVSLSTTEILIYLSSTSKEKY